MSRPADSVDPETIRTPEKRFQGQVEELAERLGWLYYHTRDSRKSKEGFPDLVLATEGQTIFAELKSEGEELSHEQEVWQAVLGSDPMIEVHAWWPKDWDFIVERLQQKVTTKKLEGGVMVEGYCLKCRERREMVDVTEETLKNGRNGCRGNCKDCGGRMFMMRNKARTIAAAPDA